MDHNLNNELFFNKPSAQFCLSTRSGGTNVATRNASNTQFTFTNVNIRKIVGARVYEKYDYFNITLTYGLWTVFSGSPAGYESIGTLNLTGLNFVCSDNKASAVVGYYQLPTISGTGNTVATTNKFLTNMFSKVDKTNLTLGTRSIYNDNFLPINTGSYPVGMFVFRIDPVEL